MNKSKLQKVEINFTNEDIHSNFIRNSIDFFYSEKYTEERDFHGRAIIVSALNAYSDGHQLPDEFLHHIMCCFNEYLSNEFTSDKNLQSAFGLGGQKHTVRLVYYYKNIVKYFIQGFILGREDGVLDRESEVKSTMANYKESNFIFEDTNSTVLPSSNFHYCEYGYFKGYNAAYNKNIKVKLNKQRIIEFILIVKSFTGDKGVSSRSGAEKIVNNHHLDSLIKEPHKNFSLREEELIKLAKESKEQTVWAQSESIRESIRNLKNKPGDLHNLSFSELRKKDQSP